MTYAANKPVLEVSLMKMFIFLLYIIYLIVSVLTLVMDALISVLQTMHKSICVCCPSCGWLLESLDIPPF